MLLRNAVSLPGDLWCDVKDLRCFPDFSTFAAVDDVEFYNSRANNV